MGTMEQAAGGMFVRSSQAPVPLTGVSIEVTGSGSAAEVCVRQRFVNVERVPIEAVYSFPLEEGSAVCELVIETGGKRLLGRIEEREKAFEQYDEALAAGHGAFLADQDRPNIFTISAGNLLPGQEATVCLRYATELEQHGGELRIMLPTTISPRYVPADMLGSADPAELERINPPTVLGRVPYGLSLTIDYTAPQGVKSVSCASHPAQVSVDGNRVRVELIGTDVQLDRDFVVNIALAQPFAPHAVVAQDGPDECAVMINLFPDPGRFARQPCEYIFLLDRSGSMAGGSIAQALDALRLALRSMEAGDAFNIIGFGSRHEMMFPHSQPYAQASLEQATRVLENWDANLGGTELLAPLQAALAAKAGELPRQLMLLTDGQVSNEAACIAAVAAHAGSVRMFTFGIGHGASEFLVRGLARACGGKAEFIHPNERIEPVVMRQFARAAAPFLRNVRVDWGGLAPNLVVPAHIGSLFAGDRLTAYARVPAGDPAEPVEVAVLADGPQGTMRFPVRVDFSEHAENAMSDDAGSGSSRTPHRGSAFMRTIVRLKPDLRRIPVGRASARQGFGAGIVASRRCRLPCSLPSGEPAHGDHAEDCPLPEPRHLPQERRRGEHAGLVRRAQRRVLRVLGRRGRQGEAAAQLPARAHRALRHARQAARGVGRGPRGGGQGCRRDGCRLPRAARQVRVADGTAGFLFSPGRQDRPARRDPHPRRAGAGAETALRRNAPGAQSPVCRPHSRLSSTLVGSK